MSLKEIFLFDPTNIAKGCQLWLDAADSSSLTLSGSNVTAWRDRSVLGNNATINNTVTYNSADKSIRTDGVSSFFTAPLDTRKTTNTYYNVFLVYKWLNSTAGTNQSLWGNDVGGGWNRFQLLSFPSASSIAYGLSRGATTPNTANISALNTSNTLLYSANYAYNITNGSYAYVNGSEQINFTEVAASPETSTQVIYFGQLGSSQYFSSIAFYEIMIFRLQMTTSVRQQIEGYLGWKWGLQGSLPANHPYKNSRPLDNIPLPPSLLVSTRPLQNVFVFNPTVISNCALWLDAADSSTLSLSGTSVIRWNNKVPGGIATTTVSSPSLSGNYLNRLQTLRFNGNSITATLLTPVGTGDYAMFAVWLTINGGTEAVLSIGPNGGPAAGLGYNGAYYNLYEWGQTESQYVAGKNQYVVESGTRVSGIKTVFYNGNSATPAAGTLNLTNTTLYVGNGTGFPINGEIGEVIVYQGTLTPAQRQQIEGYLAWKWGLEANLPTIHPYRTNPPDLPAIAPRGITQLKSAFFSPRNLSGCRVWLDGADPSTLSLSGTSVTQWTDKSGTGNNYTNNGTLTYSNRGVSFPGTAFMQNTTLTGFPFGTSPSLTTFIVFAYTNVSSTRGLFQYGNVSCGKTGYVLYVDIDNKIYGTLYCGDLSINTSVSANTTTIVSDLVTYTGVSGSLTRAGWLNGTPMTTPTASATSVNLTSSGSSRLGDAANQTFLGTIYEVLFYSTTLSTLQRQQVEGYLAWKWRLQANLPSTHPFKLFPPSP